jgi:hypothetical protein
MTVKHHPQHQCAQRELGQLAACEATEANELR